MSLLRFGNNTLIGAEAIAPGNADLGEMYTV